MKVFRAALFHGFYFKIHSNKIKASSIFCPGEGCLPEIQRKGKGIRESSPIRVFDVEWAGSRELGHNSEEQRF